MKSLELLTLVRHILTIAIHDCTVQQFKAEVIHREFLKRLNNVNQVVTGYHQNKKILSKQQRLVNQVIRDVPHNTKNHYDSLKKALEKAKNSLPSAIDFID